MTREEFHRWAENQPRGRFELVAGRVVAMAPERGAHLRAKAEVLMALKNAIAVAGVDCEALPDGATVEVGDDTAYEPDAVVTCGERMGDNATVAPNPVVVVEVLSPSTRAVDTGAKLTDYFRVPSIHHYLILRTDRRVVVHHRRLEDGGIETRLVAAGPIRLDPPGIAIAAEGVFGA